MSHVTPLPEDHHAAVFSLDSGRRLRDPICEHLGISPGKHEERTFDDGEHKIRPLQSVRDQDVYLVESLYSNNALSVNDKLVRTLFFLAAMRDAGAERVTLIAPYLCYARKDRRTKPRDSVSIRYLATVLESMGLDRVATMDVHNPAAYENAFRIPAEHLTAAPLFVDSVVPLIGDREVVVVSPDAGGAKRAEGFRQRLDERLGRSVPLVFIEKFRSEDAVWGGTVVGDVKNRVAILLDDLISSGTTLAEAATACREHGATAVYAAVTHGVFSSGANQTLDDPALERLVFLDTLPPARLAPNVRERRAEVLSCAPLLAGAIQRLHTGGSLVELSGL
ncbi:ribose-phosphate pyrophosphokinase [Salinibacter sp. 10B]|nr:ribose-phosphate pyrophosphokinase [Salinibacter sp. 10B]